MPLLKTESYKKGIVYSTLLNVISKGLVFVNSLIVAFYFGTQLKTDIYFYIYNTIVILSAFITSLNASVLIPESMRIRTLEGEKEANSFLNAFIYGYIAFTLILCLIFLADPVHAFGTISSFEMQAIENEKMILLLSVPLIIMMPLVNLLTDIMTSYKYFTMPMIAAIINGVFSISFVVLFHNTLDVKSLLVGLVLSYTVNLFLLVSLMIRKLSWNFRFTWVNIEKRIWKNIGFAQLGNITSSLSTYAPLYLLSSFSAGIITSLNFAQQISSLPTHLITVQFSSVAGIKFNEQYVQGNYQELNKTFISTAGFLLFVLVPVSGILFLFPKEIVSILFQRGAFGDQGVAETALFLKYLGFLAPLWVINLLSSRLFMAAHKIKESFWYQAISNIGLIVVLYFAVKEMGVIGYPLAVVGVHLVKMVLFFFMEKVYLGIIQYKTLLVSFLKIIILNIIIAFVMYAVKAWLGRYAISNIFQLGIGGIIYGLLVFWGGIKFRINEAFNMVIAQWVSVIFKQRRPR
ncbi:MAG TPA: lipid II flippase MurJ [Niabella sp.]|nr:lipid II flippase MurJ [Niabella sp.]